MRLRVWSVLFTVALSLLAMTSQQALANSGSSGISSSSYRFAPGDNDNDGLADDLDPDDDNDGITDDQDAAPFDPLIPGPGSEPTPGPIATDADSDGDGIPNDADPDDNNDGVVDGPLQAPTAVPTLAPSPVPTPVPTIVAPTPIPATTEPIAETPEAPIAEPVTEAPVGPAQEAPVVTALPSTGTGSRPVVTPSIAILVGVATLAVSAMISRKTRISI